MPQAPVETATDVVDVAVVTVVVPDFIVVEVVVVVAFDELDVVVDVVVDVAFDEVDVVVALEVVEVVVAVPGRLFEVPLQKPFQGMKQRSRAYHCE